MFEGKPPAMPGAKACESSETASGELSALDWAELTAKLAAARDLRRHLAETGNGALASFDAQCAREIAAHHGYAEENDKYCVNPDDLANGKWPGSNSGGRAEKGEPAIRGNT